MTIKDHIRDIPDYPSKGITYRDISPLLHKSEVFQFAIDTLYEKLKEYPITTVVGIESKGYIFAAPLALKLGVGLSIAKKRTGDHPLDVVGIDYAIEMGTHRIEMMRDAIKKGDKVVIVDDLLATGVTAKATAEIVQQLGGEVIAFAFLADIDYYDGIKQLEEIAPVIHIYNC